MIAKLILTSLFAVLLSSGLINKSENASQDDLTQAQNTEQVVRAIMHNGEVIPHINLPVVEITGELNTDMMVNAEMINGEIVPVINLEEVVITPNSGLNSI